MCVCLLLFGDEQQSHSKMGSKSSKEEPKKEEQIDRIMRMPSSQWSSFGGPEDPLYKTWWYFVKATKTGADVPASEFAQTSIYFSDADVRTCCTLR